MIEALGYLWLRPYWLALIPAALALAIIVVRRSRGLGAWERAVDPQLMEAMRSMGRVLPGRAGPGWWPALALAALGLALAGPASERRDSASFRNLDAVLLVIDLSPSVTRGDMLFDVVTAGRIITDAAGARQAGVIVYSGEAYVAAPLSTDAAALAGTLALLDAETMPVAGSRPAEALRLAVDVLREARVLASDVVLISDGGGLGGDARQAAVALAREGAVLSVIRVPGSPRDAGALSALARTGAGAEGTLIDPFPVVRQLARRPVERLASTGYSMLAVEDLGRYLLLLALAPALLLLPRRGRA